MLEQGLDKIFEAAEGKDKKKGSLANAENISKVLSNKLEGISPVVVELIIAIVTKQKEAVKGCIKKIAEECCMD